MPHEIDILFSLMNLSENVIYFYCTQKTIIQDKKHPGGNSKSKKITQIYEQTSRIYKNPQLGIFVFLSELLICFSLWKLAHIHIEHFPCMSIIVFESALLHKSIIPHFIRFMTTFFKTIRHKLIHFINTF